MAGEEGGGHGGGGSSLEFTPTWVAALVCTVIVTLSLVIEKLLQLLSKRLKRMNRRFLFRALRKLKEELMLMGLISLLLARLQDVIVRLCIPESWAHVGLPCKHRKDAAMDSNTTSTARFSIVAGRHLLSEESPLSHCSHGMVPLVSYHALHDLHILIFVLAIVHVVVCALTVLLGAAKISQWRRWEESILEKINDTEDEHSSYSYRGRNHPCQNDDFIKNRFMGINANKRIWLRSFIKHLRGPVTESDYAAMRMGFVLTHCRDKPNFNFHEYMINSFEADFMEIVTISWYVWVIVIISLLLNVAGWRTYYWIAFLPLMLVLIVGTKLEQVITLLATEVVRRQTVVADVKIQPSDRYFWFNKPTLFLLLIRVTLSCNAFAIALFFWVYSRYGYHACSMERAVFTIPRLIIVASVQILCSYSTLPLYAIVTQMGSSYHQKAMEISRCGSVHGVIKKRSAESSDVKETVKLPEIDQECSARRS